MSGALLRGSLRPSVYLVSPEVFDVLNKILKNDEENGCGEVQMMCELFSGERTSYRFASESTREIPAIIPFVIYRIITEWEVLYTR